MPSEQWSPFSLTLGPGGSSAKPKKRIEALQVYGEPNCNFSIDVACVDRMLLAIAVTESTKPESIS